MKDYCSTRWTKWLEFDDLILIMPYRDMLLYSIEYWLVNFVYSMIENSD